MKIQQSTNNLIASKRPTAPAPEPEQFPNTDSVELGNQARELETDIGRMYSLYRTSNSQYEQKNLKREMIARLDSSTGALPARQELQDLLGKLFDKNEKAWELKGQQNKPCPGTEVEFNAGKHDVAKGQPLCGDNLFNLGEWQKRKNLIPLLQPVKAEGSLIDDLNRDHNLIAGTPKALKGSTSETIKRDTDLLGGTPKRELGSTIDVIDHDLNNLKSAQPQAMGSGRSEIEHDYNLLQSSKPGKSFHNGFAAKLFNRLA